MLSALNHCINSYGALKRGSSRDEVLAFKSLSENVSFRLPKTAEHDKWVGFKVLLSVSKVVLSGGKSSFHYGKNDASAILDSAFFNEEKAFNNVVANGKSSPTLFISKLDAPRIGAGLAAWRILARLWTFALPHAFRGMKEKNKTNHALIIRELVEQAAVLHLLEMHHIKLVFDFSPYEIDSNWGYLLMKERNIEVVKVPSCGPLTTHNYMVLADKLVVSCQYQFDEIKTLPNIRVENLEKWMPKSALEYVEKYAENPPPPARDTIGYYSHASWQRKKEGNSEIAWDSLEAESALLKALGKILQSNKHLQLIIFLHPRERKAENIEAAEIYYKTLLGCDFEFYSGVGNSTHFFNAVDLGVGSFSTVLFERIFCGYKTIIGSVDMGYFPIKESSLGKVCISHIEELEEKLLPFSNMTVEEYFEKNELEGYRYFEFPYFQNQQESST